jgi:hypothetical protein
MNKPSKPKRWRPKAPYRLVAVEREDSQRALTSWQSVDEFSLPDAVTCLSVGFLIVETKSAVALAPNLGDLEQARSQACGVIRIPSSAIKHIVDV